MRGIIQQQSFLVEKVTIVERSKPRQQESSKTKIMASTPAGALVRLKGLKAKPDLNGRLGVLLRNKPNEKGRYAIKLLSPAELNLNGERDRPDGSVEEQSISVMSENFDLRDVCVLIAAHFDSIDRFKRFQAMLSMLDSQVGTSVRPSVLVSYSVETGVVVPGHGSLDAIVHDVLEKIKSRQQNDFYKNQDSVKRWGDFGNL